MATLITVRTLPAPDVLRVTKAGGAPAVQYYQRVWSTGTAVWCYYTQAAINPTPAPSETTPNWVGSAVDHNVVAIL
jgi:hypothetical protein